MLGMRPEIYRRIEPMVTVFSRQSGVNPQLAARDVLLAIPGLSTDQVDQYIALREAARAQNQPPFPEAAAFTTSYTMVATIRSRTQLEDGTVFAREAVALLRPTPRRVVTFLAWRESTAAPLEASNP